MIPTQEEMKIANKVWDKVFGMEWTVESMDYLRKKAGTKYTVKRKCDGKWSCDCQSFIYHSGTHNVRTEDGQLVENSCKHIRFAMGKEGIKYARTY